MFSITAGATNSATRRLIQRSFTRRSFAVNEKSLLAYPLPEKPSFPAELVTTPLSDAVHNQLQEKYAEFNENCRLELQEMNANIIENIVNRGGEAGWDTTEDAMKKTFEFNSFEECQSFCNEVSKFANKIDHHPEWSLVNGGKSVQVTLTSHFAGNKVTRLDFQLAEEMNTQFDITASSFKMFPMFSRNQIANFKIALGAFVLGSFVFKFVTGTNHEQKYIPALPYVSFANATPPSRRLEDVPSQALGQLIVENYPEFTEARQQINIDQKVSFKPISGA